MTRLLSIITLVLSLVLFPPAVLAVVSNNAVPGDSTYPIKRGLEDIIFAVVSLTPTTKVWFAAARSDRRFQEVTVLIAQGKKASETLNELVEQTQVAASQIDKVSDPAEKAKLIKQLSESITKYDAGLSQISAIASTSTPLPAPAVTAQSPATVPQPSAISLIPTARPQASPAPQPTVIRNSPIPVPAVTLSPSPTPSPVSNPSGESDIDRARSELEKIKKKLEQDKENSDIHEGGSKENKSRQETGSSKEKDRRENNSSKQNSR